MNSSLAGLVMITGVCDDVSVYSALFIGLEAGIVYLMATQLLEYMRIDDPVEAVQIHGICGFFGVLNVGIFGQKRGLVNFQLNSFKQFGIQFLGACSLTLWAMITSYTYFKSLDSLGKLRVNKFYEIVGIDILMHTMSDQIGESDDFDRDSRTLQTQYEKQQQRKRQLIKDGGEENEELEMIEFLRQGGISDNQKINLMSRD